MDYKGIPFEGGLEAPTGDGGLQLVTTMEAMIDQYQGNLPNETLVDSLAITSVGTQERQLWTSLSVMCLDWENYSLVDESGTSCILWGNRTLQDSNGSATVDWENRTLKDNSGFAAIDWQNSVIRDGSNNQMITWASGNLGFFGSYGDTRRSGGAATAGVAYTSTEQGMLNIVYSALRAYGLLT